jgi:hypothetical protein
VSWPVARDRVEDGRGVLGRLFVPDEVPGVNDHQAADRQPLVEKLRVGERDDTVAIESVNDTFKGQLDLERHGGHTPAG